MRVYKKKLSQLTIEQYKWIYNNNLKARGLMQRSLYEDLDRFLYRPKTNLDIYIAVKDGRNYGWAFTKKISRTKYEIQIWVPKKYRRAGIGTKLISSIKRHHKKSSTGSGGKYPFKIYYATGTFYESIFGPDCYKKY